MEWPHISDWVAVLGPYKPEGARLEVKPAGQGVSLAQLDPSTDFLSGERAIYWAVSRGDFTGDGQEDLLLWKQSDSLSGTFAECSVLVVDLGPSPHHGLRLREERKLGRCA